MSECYKSGFIAVAGRTNVGKSTLLNALIGQKISIVSDRPQTTRNIIRLIRTTDTSQMIFLDSPGFHKPKNKLGRYMSESAEESLSQVDLILFLVEEDIAIGPGDRRLIDSLSQQNIPVVLVINKIDKVPREEILKKIELYKDYEFIKDIVPVSAYKGINIDTLVEVMESYLPEGPMFFPEDMITDRAEKFLIGEILREKMLRYVKEEIPHGIAVEITSMKQRNKDFYDIEATVFCEKKTHKGIIIGKDGAMLKRIATSARKAMEDMLDCRVNLCVWVKVMDDWRDKPNSLKEFGYVKDKDI